MGLDIFVYRVTQQKEDSDETFLLSESPELEVFSNLSFSKEDDYYDIEGELKKLGHNPEDLQWRGSEYGKDVKFSFATEEGTEFELINPPTIKKTERFLQVEEVGYQRKGANKKFYADGMWDSPCVLKIETLKEHWEKYFSHQTPDSEGGWGSGVEYTLEDEEMKSRFKENIIDKFVEGETFVCYS